MSNEVFEAQTLVEKLSKLNNSQQSIESLSRWCISHRKKAKQIVETWDKLFSSSQKEQCVSFLYLANDILQNSRRKGSEFVNEFWKVLPAALKHVYESGDEYGKKAVARLVDIWEERKVFGSRGQSLKDEMLGKSPSSVVVSNGKGTNPIKIVKKDAHSVRIKLAIGGLPEKILTAFQTVFDDHSNEETAFNMCNTAVHHLSKIGEDVDSASNQGSQHGSSIIDEIQQQEQALQQCIGQLENAEATRAALVYQLKGALQEHESKLELIRSQLQVARFQVEHANNMKKRMTSPSFPVPPTTPTISATEAMKVVEQTLSSAQPISTPPHPQPVVSFAPLRTTEEENKKAAAAAVAAKLAASTSSAQMLTSVLSSLVAEEAASMNGSLKSGGFTAGLPVFPPEKRAKLEKPMPVSDVVSSEVGSSAYFTQLQQQPITNMPIAPPTNIQSLSQGNQIQAAFAPAPPPPPPIPLSSTNPPASQYVQSAGVMVGVMPYPYGANTLPPPPPPPLPPHIAMGLARPSTQPPQQPSQSQSQSQQSQQQQQQQQPPATGGFYRPPGIGFYGQSHQAATPPVPRH